jgi:L-fucose isomerase-like protein
MNYPAFTYIPLASEITDRQSVASIRRDFSAGLAGINGREAEAFIDHNQPLILLVISGGTEALIIDRVGKRALEYRNEPILLIAHPGNNSLAASLEALAHLRQKGLRGEILFFRSAADEQARATLRERVLDLSVYRALKKSRVGLIGKPSEWLVASTFPEDAFKKVWGITIREYGLDEVFKEAAAVESEAGLAAVTGFDSSTVQFREAFKVYTIWDNLARTEQLQALSVECFTLFNRYNTHGCFALSRLNDSGIVAGCEGDLVSTLTMLWIKLLLGQASWMANPVEIDAAERSLWLAHCTVPTTLVTGFTEATHYETGCGVALAGVLADGPVTVARIGGANLDRIWLAEAEIIASGNSPHRCRTQAKIRFREASAVTGLLEHPLGNHLVLTRGHHAARLAHWWKTFIAP